MGTDFAGFLSAEQLSIRLKIIHLKTRFVNRYSHSVAYKRYFFE